MLHETAEEFWNVFILRRRRPRITNYRADRPTRMLNNISKICIEIYRAGVLLVFLAILITDLRQDRTTFSISKDSLSLLRRFLDQVLFSDWRLREALRKSCTIFEFGPVVYLAIRSIN